MQNITLMQYCLHLQSNDNVNNTVSLWSLSKSGSLSDIDYLCFTLQLGWLALKATFVSVQPYTTQQPQTSLSNTKHLTSCFSCTQACLHPFLLKEYCNEVKAVLTHILFLCVCLSESAGEDCCMKDYSPFSPQHSDTSTSSSLYMESCEFSV